MINDLKKVVLKMSMWFFASTVIAISLHAQAPRITLDFTKATTSVSPMLYGLMTEEINHSYDGGLYAELIRNRIFKDNPAKPEGWSLVNEDTINSKASIKLMATTPDNVPYDLSLIH